MSRCRTTDGVHIPGCIGCAWFGHSRGCTCQPKDDETEARLLRIERAIEKLAQAKEGAS